MATEVEMGHVSRFPNPRAERVRKYALREPCRAGRHIAHEKENPVVSSKTSRDLSPSQNFQTNSKGVVWQGLAVGYSPTRPKLAFAG